MSKKKKPVQGLFIDNIPVRVENGKRAFFPLQGMQES